MNLRIKRLLSLVLAMMMVVSVLPVSAFAAEADDTLQASLDKAKTYIDGITINNSSNDPATVVKTFKKHFTWDNEKRENSKSYLFDWSYYNGVVFEGIEFVYEVTGETVYRDYVLEYMSSLINSNGTWATCTNSGYTSKQCAGYNNTHGADCYKTASLLMDAYEMSGDSRYLTMAATLYADLDNAAKSYSLSKAGGNFRHTWATDPSPDLWLDGLYMILPFYAEYAAYIGDTAELDLIVDRMQWVSDNMYNSSRGLFYHAADSATSNSGTFWLRSIGWYAAAIVDIMDSMTGSNLEAMKAQLVKLVDGMEACQNASNGMWLNNMAASQSSSNPYETSGTALVCYAVMKAVNHGWLDESYADMAILAFNGICNEKLSGNNLTDICFKGAPGSSNSTFYDNEGKGLGPFIMFYAEVLEYANNNSCDHEYETVTVDATCVEEGTITTTCIHCGDETVEVIPATGIHEYEITRVEATETTDGSVTYTCASCGHSYSDVIPATGETLYALDTRTGTVAKNAGSETATGAKVIITYATGRQETADVTVSMLKTVGGSAVSTAASGTQTGLTVTYEGNVVADDFTLVVEREWIALPSGYVFTLDTDGIETGENNKYMILGSNKDYALTLSGTTVGAAAVTVENNTVTLEDPANYSFYFAPNSKESNTYLLTRDGSKTVYHSGGNMYYGTDSKGYWYIGSGSNGAYRIYDYDNLNWYLNYGYVWASDSVSRFAVSSNSRTVRLFKLTNSGTGDYVRLDGALEQFFTTAEQAEEADVLQQLKIQVSTDGITASGEEIALTADMISWNKAFDGKTAGTYTGTVTYEGQNLGSFTVTVTLEHSYETITLDATCTEDGSIITRCTVCGDETVEVIPATGHSYVCTETAATCGQAGAKVYTCSACGDSYAEEIPATGNHSYEYVTVDATCTAEGTYTGTCTVCGHETVETIPAAGHSYTCTETPATCGQAGAKVYTCSVCGDSYSETIPATGDHSYESVKVDPTCVEKGSITYTCGICGHSYVESIPATGTHIYTSETVAPTCTEDGAVIYSCAFCAKTYSETIAATGHSYTCTVTEATCETDGSKVYTCETCGDSYTEVIEAFGHDYKSVVTAPTCLEGGFTTFTCQGCGHSYVADETEALGHRYETARVEATCETDGSVTYYCVCGDTYTEVIPAAGHSYKSVVTAPTCVSGGYTTHTCTTCGHSYVSDEIAAPGHDYEVVTVEPTCTVGGYTSRTCTVCGEGGIYDETQALGHDYDSVTVDPTETEDGYTTHTCSRCGHSYTDNYVDALGHTMVSVVTDPTCTQEGYTTHTCATCGEVIVDSYVPALGHNYQTVTVEATCETDGSATHICTTCGDTYTEVLSAYGHDYTATVTAPTCLEGGHTVYTCERCGDSYVSDYTEALGHSYDAIITDVTCETDGYTTYLCTGCGHSYTGETVKAPGHSYETVTQAATCTADGSVTHTCTACGDTCIEVISATGHDYEAVVTEPTCENGGHTTYTCVCGESYVADHTEAIGHSYICEEANGNQIYTCEHCGDSYTLTTGWVSIPGTYVLDTDGIDIGSGNRYIVLGSNKDYALTLSGTTVGAAAVEVEDDTVVLEDASRYEFYFANNSSKESGSYLLTQDGSKGIYHADGNMYYGSNNKGYWHIGSSSNGAYQLYDFDNRNWYLNYGYVWASDSVSRFAVSSNARSVRLYKATDSYVRLYGAMDQIWVHGAAVTEEAILAKVQLQTSADGITVKDSFAVTADMLTWDKTLDGYTAGVYTAAVAYRGEEIGTITVTVTGEHTYASETTEATCESAGFTTHTCTVCGLSHTDGHVDALGHSYTAVENGTTVTYTCDRCGHSYSESLLSFRKVSSMASGDSYVITLYSGNKYYALSHAGNTISAVQISVSGDVITTEITADLLWDYSGSKLSYKSGSTTYYLYAQPAGGWWGWWSTPTLTVSSSNSSSVSFSSSKLKVGSYYLRYSGGSISLNSSATTSYLFSES